jgi:multidrug efflux pump subunit AcrB
LSPALCAKVLRETEVETGLRRSLARASDALTDGYAALLRRAMARRGLWVGIGFAWFALGLAMLGFGVVDREFIPSADRGGFFVFTRAPEGATIEFTDRYHSQVEEKVGALPEVERMFSVIALGLGAPGIVNEGIVIGSLAEERDRHIRDVIEGLRPQLADVTGVQAFASEFQALGRGFGGAPVSIVLMGPDVGELARYADLLAQRVEEEVPGLFNVRSDLLLNKPQLDVEIDRDRASDLGVSVRDVASALQVLLGGVDLSTFKLGGQTYDVIVQLERRERSRPGDIPLLYVHGTDNQLIPLSSVVKVSESTAARGVPHFDRLRAATVTAALAPGISQGEALERVRGIAEEILPAGGGWRIAFSGESEQFYESGRAIVFAYLLGVAVIYLVLAAQFESFVHPLTILIAVALSFTGALATLLLTGTTLNLFSQIGMVMLVGLVAKNSILIVEFANQLREQGLGVAEAAYEAGRTRFRPILMTALSTIVGMLPIALGGNRTMGELLGVGTGGELRAPLGIAAVGGMAFSTALTVFVVPAAYVMVESLRARFGGARKHERPPASPAAAQVD